jgi:hypothetical protein
MILISLSSYIRKYFKEVLRGIREENWICGSLITESLPNVILGIRLDNEDWIIDVDLGRIRRNV